MRTNYEMRNTVEYCSERPYLVSAPSQIFASETFGIVQARPPPAHPSCCACQSAKESKRLPHLRSRFEAGMAQRKRQSLYTVEYKLNVISWYRNNGENKHAAALHFGIDQKRLREFVEAPPHSTRNTHACALGWGRYEGTILAHYRVSPPPANFCRS